MRTTSTTGPDRPERDQLTDPAEVAEARRIEGYAAYIDHAFGGLRARGIEFVTAADADPDWLSEAEAFDSAAEAGAAWDRDLWGDDPWTI